MLNAVHCHDRRQRGFNVVEYKRINLRVSAKLHEAVTALAKERGLSLNATCILALETYTSQQHVIGNLDELVRIYNALENE